MKSKRFMLVILTLIFALSMITSGCSKQEKKFPSKQITIVVGFAPGGASDIVSRIAAKLVQDQLKTPVVVENKTGASGSVGMSFVKSNPKDGYTIGYMPVETTMVKALGFADIQPSDFEFIGRAMVIPAAITVNSKSPWKTVDDFIKYAKENPSKVTVGNSGTGSIWQIAAVSVEEKTGVKFNHVPFEGAAPAVAALMGGHIDAVTVSPGEVLSGVKSGDLKVLGIIGEKRSTVLPDVPTLKEKGIDASIEGWGGFAVAKGTPADVKKVLEDAFKAALNSDDFKKLCIDRSMTPSYMSGQEFDKYAGDQYKFYSEMIPKLGLKK